MRVLVFDTETSGLPTEKNPSIYETQKWPYIIQLSFIVYNLDTNILETLVNDYIKINNNVIISEESTKIHNITREMTEKGISITDALIKFKNYANRCDILVAHNISFDKQMLYVEGIRNNIKINIMSKTLFCTMKNSVEMCKIEKIDSNGEKFFKYPSLTELYYYLFKINPKNTHNALNDILLCLRCFCKIKYDIDITKNRDIRRLIRECY